MALSVIAAFAFMGANRWVDHSLDVLNGIDQWMAEILELQANGRHYVNSGERRYLERYEDARARERVLAKRLGELVKDNSGQVANAQRTTSSANAVVAILQTEIDLTSAGKRHVALLSAASAEEQGVFAAFGAGWRRLRLDESQLLAQRRANSRTHGFLALSGASVLGFASFALLWFAWSLRTSREDALELLASGARIRLRALSDIAAALAQARTKAQVLEVIIEQGMLIANAQTCTVYMMNDSGAALELMGHRGVAPDIVDKIRHIAAVSLAHDTFDNVLLNRSLWAENESDYQALFPELVGLKVDGPRAKAFWSVPLIVEGRPLGLFAMGYYEPRTFSDDDRLLVETLSKQCAQALLRATRMEKEDETRRWLETTLRSIGDAVIATDAEGQVTYMNPVAVALTGFEEEEARGLPLERVFRIYSEQSNATIENPVTRVLREGRIIGLAHHTLLRAKNGEEVAIDDSGALIRDEMGKVLGVVMVFRDVSREKRARERREFLAKAGEALASSLDYQATLSTVARLATPTVADWCGIDLIDSNTMRPYQAAVAHIDPAKLEFIRKLGEKFPPNPQARTGAPEVIRSGKPEIYTVIPEELLEKAATNDEHMRLIRELKLGSAIVVPLRGCGSILGAITFVYAESGRRYTHEDLYFAEDFARRAAMAIENAMALKEAEMARAQERHLRAEAEVANRAKDEFLAVVSHELRTPLNAILGWTILLRGRNPPRSIDDGLAVIERNAHAQAKVVDDVLDVSRIISGKLSLSLGSMNVAEIVAASVETVAPAAEAKNISISTQIQDALSITADAGRIQQVVWNLLSNAVKFTPKGGRIAIEAHSEGSEVCITVVDTGEGIASRMLSSVFEPFRQADASTTRRHGGLGLGLAIVKYLVSAHGGTVSVSSAGEGRGSTFCVQLPARAAVAAVSKVRTPAAVETVAEQPNVSPRLDGLKVLLVDDEQDALDVISEVLREYGAEVYLAASVVGALETFKQLRPDVVLSDIGIPVLDGYALIRRIRALPAELGGQTPAAALTAYARAEDAERAFAAGYQMHVAKPIEPRKLAAVVANLSGRSLV